jgi:hypothetical protein
MNIHREQFRRRYQHGINLLIQTGNYGEAETELGRYEKEFGDDVFTKNTEVILHTILDEDENAKVNH